MVSQIENAAGEGSIGEGSIPRARDIPTKGLLAAGGVAGAVATSACCIVPLVLFSLGVSGAWIGNLTALYPYKPYFVSIAIVFLASGFYMVYRKPKNICQPGSYCASPGSDRILKISLWSASLLVLAALVFPYVAPYLLA